MTLHCQIWHLHGHAANMNIWNVELENKLLTRFSCWPCLVLLLCSHFIWLCTVSPTVWSQCVIRVYLGRIAIPFHLWWYLLLMMCNFSSKICWLQGLSGVIVSSCVTVNILSVGLLSIMDHSERNLPSALQVSSKAILHYHSYRFLLRCHSGSSVGSAVTVLLFINSYLIQFLSLSGLKHQMKQKCCILNILLKRLLWVHCPHCYPHCKKEFLQSVESGGTSADTPTQIVTV